MPSRLYALYEDSEFAAELLRDGKCKLTSDLPFEGFKACGGSFERTVERNELAELFIVTVNETDAQEQCEYIRMMNVDKV